MSRPPVIPAEKKIRIVVAVIPGDVTIAEFVRTEKVSEQSIGRWTVEFLEAGKVAMVAGKTGPWSREEQLEAEVAELTQALGEAAVEIPVWKNSAEGRLGPPRRRAGVSLDRDAGAAGREPVAVRGLST